jgi:melibiose permease/lactose/raffinose/galactose permease
LVLVFASIGQFLAGGLIPVLVTGNAVFMYRLLGICISSLFLSFTLLTYFGVRENPSHDENREKVNLKKMWKVLFQNDQLIIVSTVILLHTIATELFLAFGMNFFYFEFGYGGIQLTIFTVFFALGTLAALMLFPLLTKRFKRMEIIAIGTMVSTLGYIVFLSLGYIMPMIEWILYGSAFLIFFGQNLFFVVLVVMTANVIEYNELNTGERNESIIFSVRPFMTKLGAALQQGLVTVVLIISGVFVYSQKVAELEIQKGQGLIEDISKRANIILSGATPQMLFILRIGMGLIPMISMLIAYILIKNKYKITEEKYDEILAALENK